MTFEEVASGHHTLHVTMTPGDGESMEVPITVPAVQVIGSDTVMVGSFLHFWGGEHGVVEVGEVTATRPVSL